MSVIYLKIDLENRHIDRFSQPILKANMYYKIAMCQALFKCFSNISSLTPHNNPMRYRNKPYFTREKIELRRGPASHRKSQNHSLDPCGLAPGTHTCSVGHPCRADVLHSEGNVLNVVCIIGWDTTQP